MTIPVFSYILGYVFLGEVLSPKQIISFLIILVGVFIISVDFSGSKRKLKKLPALYMTIVCILISVVGIIFKYVTISGDFWVSSFWQHLGIGICGLIIFIFHKQYRKEFLNMNKTGAPVALVYLVGSFQPVMVLLLTLFATKFFPNIAKENLSRRVLIPKIISILIIVCGSVMLFK